jgi:hypothetical protein
MARHIRKATTRDVEAILSLYADARAFMRSQGNAGQWGDSYPGAGDVERDLAADALYACVDEEDEVLAAFFFLEGPDPTYAEIEGAWADDGPYHVMHRVAARAGSGAGRFSIAWATRQVRSVRIDTHEDNAPMRHVLSGLGFTACGTIHLADGSPRIAYQHIDEGHRP